MKNYIHNLEQQNEELKQKLAESQQQNIKQQEFCNSRASKKYHVTIDSLRRQEDGNMYVCHGHLGFIFSCILGTKDLQGFNLWCTHGNDRAWTCTVETIRLNKIAMTIYFHSDFKYNALGMTTNAKIVVKNYKSRKALLKDMENYLKSKGWLQ